MTSTPTVRIPARATPADRARELALDLGPAWVTAGGTTAVLLTLQVVDARGALDGVVDVLAAAATVLLAGSAVAVARTRPGVALAVAWGTALAWSTAGLPLLSGFLALGVVAFGCARWGTRAESLAALASVPLVVLVTGGGAGVPGGWVISAALSRAGLELGVAGALVPVAGLLVVLVAGSLVLAAPLLAGAVARRTDRHIDRRGGDADTVRA